MRPHLLERLGLATLILGIMGGCAAVLGFEDTTLRTSSDEGGAQADSGTDDDGGSRPDGSVSRLTSKPASPIVRRGQTTEITVEIARGSDVTGDVTARLSDLPVGVTATTASLPAAASTATLTLTAAANATLGPKTVQLTAEGTSLPAAEVRLLVADPAGALDVTFDNDGFLVEPSRGVAGTFFTVGVLDDQRIVAGGAGPAPTAAWLMRRYASSGVPDAAFNALASGPGVAPPDGEARAFAVDAAGNIVFVGSSTMQLGTRPQLTIVRLKPSGALDTTFAGGVIRPLATESVGGSAGFGVAIQPDGAIVVVGSRRDLLDNESGVIARFRPDGTRDPTFNGGTTVAIAGARFIGVSLEAAGILVAGSTTEGALPSFILTRRTPTGASDPTFGTAGTAAFGNTYRANAFARLPDGFIALVGDVLQGAPGYTAGVANANGAAVFARGYANAPAAGFFGIAVQGDGRILAAGHTAVPNGEARVGRILPDGNPDTSFSDGGTAILEPAGLPNAVDVTLFSAAVQGDGRILVAGNRSNGGGVIYRLWP